MEHNYTVFVMYLMRLFLMKFRGIKVCYKLYCSLRTRVITVSRFNCNHTFPKVENTAKNVNADSEIYTTKVNECMNIQNMVIM